MPERSTPHEDAEELIRSSYTSGPPQKGELGEKIRQLAVGTPVHLSDSGRQWHRGFVPDVALTIVDSWKEGTLFAYKVRDKDGKEFSVRDTDIEVDTNRSIDSRRAA